MKTMTNYPKKASFTKRLEFFDDLGMENLAIISL
jgi:hypothetical protein